MSRTMLAFVSSDSLCIDRLIILIDSCLLLLMIALTLAPASHVLLYLSLGLHIISSPLIDMVMDISDTVVHPLDLQDNLNNLHHLKSLVNDKGHYK